MEYLSINQQKLLWYNKTLFDELGLEVPTTYEELARSF